MSRIISIEGNIGSGKSTLVHDLQVYFKNKDISNDKVVFLQEPVDVWNTIRDDNGTILEHFYKDQVKYSFPFQMMAYISRLSKLRETIKKYPESIIITERSLFTDKFVFAKMLYDNEKIDEISYQIYLKWFNDFINDLPKHEFIYIKASPEKCLERINRRNRSGESIELDYLVNCDKYHDNMLSSHECYSELILDGNIDMDNSQGGYNMHINSVELTIFNNYETNEKSINI
jgi:deoxyadenosine/deoxycytidine kinase